jgi:ABC-type Fe3+-hydroxamate transport system substrate-binding protein
MKSFKDQLGNNISINYPPQRIISLVPSQTEFLFDLGLNTEIIGVTRYCVYPETKCQNRIKVGGTKKVDFDLIFALLPDLIIANKEENTQEDIERLQEIFPVWVSDINNLNDAFDMMASLGEITDKSLEAKEIIFKIKKSFHDYSSEHTDVKVAYFIWRKPYMVAGGDTFINNMLFYAGYKNVFENKRRYPEVSDDDLRIANPDFILLSSEPYPFKEKHLDEFKNICPSAKVILVDGEYFSWYGSRLLGAMEYFNTISAKLKT